MPKSSVAPLVEMLATSATAVEIRIKGTVQGVGFRPAVYQLATHYGLRGEVYNDAAGVLIRAAGTDDQIDQLIAVLPSRLPPLAKLESLEWITIDVATVTQVGFEITGSRPGLSRTQISPDAATCPDCLADTFNPSSPYYGYPFTNCTHCGPRLSIIRAIPYDRDQTSMATFAMCPSCQRAYGEPLNRRFHAQPVACPSCGPQIWLERSDGQPLATDTAALAGIDAACTLLQEGHIVAIKGLGGFHLACDASNPVAIRHLRQRKGRPDKPLALMMRDVAMVQYYCQVSQPAQALLESPAAPIVLLPAHHPCPDLAPRLKSLGVMLPYTPLHHLLLQRLNRPIVLTSGNRSGQPQCIDNSAARTELASVASYLLLHDREIVNRVDDSVVRVVMGQRQTLRRSRGYAPAPLRLPRGLDGGAVLAMGGELKNTFALGRSGEVILSQHLGDLENAAALAAYEATLQRYQQLFEHRPEAIAADLHPDYLSTQLAERLAERLQVPLYGVQHHHAHVAACMVEHGLPVETEPVLGVALDGLGYGADGTLWGGEFMVAHYCDFQRVAHLQPVAMLGGAQAIRQPWRSTYAQLMTAFDWEMLAEQFGDLELVQFLAARPRRILDRMLATGMGAPLATSAGRLFDAVAAAVGCGRERVSYEGQGAMELEALVPPGAICDRPYPWAVIPGDVPVLSAGPLWPRLLQDLQQGIDRCQIATRFHQGMTAAVAHLAGDLARRHQLQRVVLTGGVFQNQVLLTGVAGRLRQQGLTVLTPHAVPANDGGLSLGQLAIATARHSQTFVCKP